MTTPASTPVSKNASERRQDIPTTICCPVIEVFFAVEMNESAQSSR